MNGEQQESARRRRTRAEVRQLVAEFVNSGMRRSEFCRGQQQIPPLDVAMNLKRPSNDENTASLVPSPSYALTHSGSAHLVQRGMQDLLAADAERLLKKGLEIESTQRQDAGGARGVTPPDELKEFEHETERARQIAASHPRFWEYLLTEELMRSKLSAIEQKYDEFNKGLLFKPRKSVSALEFLKWVPARAEEVKSVAQSLSIIVEQEFAVAWGKPGQSGNALQILQAVNKIDDACTVLLDWELEVASTDLPAPLTPLPATLRGATTVIINELKRFPDELSRATQEATQDTGSTKRRVEIKLTIPSPPQVAKFVAQWEEVRKKVVPRR